MSQKKTIRRFIPTMQHEYRSEILEQHDGVGGDYYEEVMDRYAPLIGQFLMEFSSLEHEINIALADALSSRSHQYGYTVIERLTTSDKIELFSKLYLASLVFQGRKGKEALVSLKARLKNMNEFRNLIVHANWPTLDTDKYVRTKMHVDNDVGNITFKSTKITTTILRSYIRDAQKLSGSIYEFSDTALSFGFQDDEM